MVAVSLKKKSCCNAAHVGVSSQRGRWHTTNAERPAVMARLASRAATHEDAHLAKYTLACIDAARDDPGASRLYLAAAAHLSAWWRNAER